MDSKIINQQDKQTTFWKRHKIILLWLIFFIGMSIRIYNLGSHNLWFDELASYVYSNLPYNLIFQRLVNHHLYYILLKFWVLCFGESEFVLRSLSMIFGVFSVLLIYKLGQSFFNIKTGLISAFILSISPIHIWYSQETMGYSLATFLVMLIVYFFILAIKKNKLYLWIGFILSSILAIYTNYICFYIIIIAGMLLFLRRYRYLLKKGLKSLCFILLIFSPQIPNFIEQFIRVKSNFWIPKPHLNSIVITFENFNVGYNATPEIYFFSFIAFSLLFIFGIQRWWQEKREELVSLILFLFIPIIFTFLISQIMPIYLDRQLMFFSPFYYIIVAAGLMRIKLPIIKTAILFSISILILSCLHNYFSYRMPLPSYHHVGVPVKKPVKPAADYINERFIKGDIVGFSEPSSVVLCYYMPKIISGKIDIFVFIIKSKLGTYWSKNVEENNGVYIETSIQSIYTVRLDEEKDCKSLEEHNFKRLWLISSSWARDGILDLHAQAIRQWMCKHYSLLESREFDGIFIDLYAKKI